MARIKTYACVVGMVAAAALAPAKASQSCFKDDKKAYELTGDSVEWSMSIAPGADCIQGMRWSYMQIYAVWVLKQPANGELVMVGPGFRYFAKPGFSGSDKFSLVVVGKNRHDEGFSTVEITVTPRDVPSAPGPVAANKPGSALTAKVADAAPPR